MTPDERSEVRRTFWESVSASVVLRTLIIAGSLIWGYAHITDVQAEHDKSIGEMQKREDHQAAVIQQMQLDEIKTATILSTLEERMAKEENKLDSQNH